MEWVRINIVLKTLKNLEIKYINALKDFLIKNKNYYEELANIKKEYLLEPQKKFNIFTAFSDFYYRENFQSDILKYILDPYTDEIGNREYLLTFFDYIKNMQKEHDNDIPFPNLRNISVVREEGHIDILIHDDKNAIIIENKLNYAADRPNQLARYLEYVKNKKNLEIKYIIYLSPDEYKYPDLESFDENYEKYKSEIKKKLVVIPGINRKGKYSLIEFLNKCLEKTKSNTGKVFIEHFISLIKRNLGGIKTMEIEKKILKEIFSKRENIEILNDLVEIWSKRKELLGQIIFEAITEQLDFTVSDEPTEAYKEIEKNQDLKLGIGGDKYGFWYGISYNTTEKKKIPILKEAFKKVLSDNFFSKNSEDVASDDEWGAWRYCNFNMPKTIDEQINEIKQILSYLEKKVKEESL